MKPPEATELRARVRNVIELTRTRRILEEETGSRDSRLQEMALEVSHQRRTLQRTVQEKQLVMQELHHRVKGNLQTVSSLLSLQRRTVADREADDALRDAQGRIAAIALVHEMLYGAEQPTTLLMSEYLRGLADLTLQTRSREADGITMDVRADPVRLPVEQAIPCALIAHELLGNALDHAFPGSRTGRLRMSLNRTVEEPDVLVLRIEDDGIGYLSSAGLPGTGLELVEALVGQLGGTMTIENGRGTSVEVRFPDGGR